MISVGAGGRVFRESSVLLVEMADGDGWVEIPEVVVGGAEEDLGMGGLLAELSEGGVAGREPGREQLLMGQRALRAEASEATAVSATRT